MEQPPTSDRWYHCLTRHTVSGYMTVVALVAVVVSLRWSWHTWRQVLLVGGPATAAWVIPCLWSWRPDGATARRRAWVAWFTLSLVGVGAVVAVSRIVELALRPEFLFRPGSRPVTPFCHIATFQIEQWTRDLVPDVTWSMAAAMFGVSVLLGTVWQRRLGRVLVALPLGLLVFAALFVGERLCVWPWATCWGVVTAMVVGAAIHAMVKRRSVRRWAVGAWWVVCVGALSAVVWWWEVGRFPKPGCPFTPAELARPIVPDADNAYVLYRQALEELAAAQRRDPSAKMKVLKWNCLWNIDEPTPPRFVVPEAYDACLATWVKATRRERIRWPVPGEPDWPFATMFPVECKPDPRPFVFLAEAKAHDAYLAGRHDEAVRWTLRVHRFAMHLHHGPEPFGLYAAEIERMALEWLPFFASKACRTPADYPSLIRTLRSHEATRPTFRQRLARHYGSWFAAWADPPRHVRRLRTIHQKYRVPVASHARHYLSSYVAWAAPGQVTTQLTLVPPWLVDVLCPVVARWEQRKARWLRNQRYTLWLAGEHVPWHRWPEHPLLPARLGTGSLLLNWRDGSPRAHQAFYDVKPRAAMAAVQCVLALCAYRVRHGRLPQRLADVVPEFLPAVPIDPYDTVAPVRYNPTTPRGPVVYVLANDHDDDRGLVLWQGLGPWGDWVFPVPAPDDTWQTYARRCSTFHDPTTQPTTQPGVPATQEASTGPTGD